MINVEIWASGAGSNADAMMEYFKDHESVRITTLGCNRKAAGAFDVAKKHGINTVYWSKDTWTAEHILKQLKERGTDIIVLAGFLKLVPQEVTQKFAGRIVNIHPSLLPSYGGKDMYGDRVHKAVLAQGESRTGITIHEVNEAFDEGRIIAQYTTNIVDGETIESLLPKIRGLEHAHFAPTVEAWIRSKFTLR